MPERHPHHGSSRPLAGLAAIAAAAILWAVAAAVARTLFDDGVEPLQLVQARAFLSAAGLAFLPGAWRRPARAEPHFVIALGVAIALVNGFYYIAIQRLAVAVALVLQYTGPALVVAWVAITTRKKPSRQIALALVGAIVGVVLVSRVLEVELGSLDLVGIACGVGAAVMFATYTLVSERAGHSYGVLGALFRGFLAASVVWLIYQVPQGWPSTLTDGGHLPRVLFVGLAGTLAPFLLYLWGVQHVRAERGVIAATLEPVVAGVIAWVWLDQVLSTVQLIGGALIIVSIASLQVRRSESDREPLPANVPPSP
ncbi:MAG TPA: EamA family transporter [Actinomycetota bacterium]|nr:EamA family transporter [Actinomycetota bacterium]